MLERGGTLRARDHQHPARYRGCCLYQHSVPSCRGEARWPLGVIMMSWWVPLCQNYTLNNNIDHITYYMLHYTLTPALVGWYITWIVVPRALKCLLMAPSLRYSLILLKNSGYIVLFLSHVSFVQEELVTNVTPLFFSVSKTSKSLNCTHRFNMKSDPCPRPGVA